MKGFIYGVAGALLGWAAWWVIFFGIDLIGLSFLFGGPIIRVTESGISVVSPFGVISAIACFFVFPVVGAKGLAEMASESGNH